MEQTNKTKQQWKNRVDVFRFIYLTIIDNIPIDQIKNKAISEYKFNVTQLQTIEYLVDHYDEIKALIISKLSATWTWERTKPILKAIIMTAYSEANALKIDKKIIIDQAIITTKKYSEPNDYKFINAILDNIIK